ncbi:MAG: GGDEF domain-containing protein [Ruminococcus sp.]|jgi:diguanylate cyclase (GGDEF)-like protein|nr:GGDEF domain-containing protein [Ruminococcus sp.]
MSKIFDKISKYFLSAKDRDEIYSRLLLFVFSVSCFYIHAYFLIISLAMSVMPITLINVGSVIVYTFAIYATHKRHYYVAAWIIVCEISVYCTLITLLMGGNHQSFVYMFLFDVILIHFFVDYARWRVRLPIALVTTVYMTLLILYSRFGDAAPLINLTEHQIGRYTLVHLIVGIAVNVFGVLTNRLSRDYVNMLDDSTVEKLGEIVYTDNLTKLYNRSYAQKVFENFKNTPETKVVCAMVDIDNFKKVNDNFGHDTGDFVLSSLSGLAKEFFRQTDYVFRWGGEEILVLLVGSDIDNGESVLNRFREAIYTNDLIYERLGYYLSITVGLAEFDCNNIQDSIKEADLRLYYGKTHGKNRVITPMHSLQREPLRHSGNSQT